MKNTKATVAIVLCIIIVGGAAYLFFEHAKAITIKPLTPVLEMDRPSKAYEGSITKLEASEVSQEIRNEFGETIVRLDAELASKKVNGQNRLSLFSIINVNAEKNMAIYMMTPTGTYCVPPPDMQAGCDNAKLKVLDTKDDSVHLLTDNFGDGLGDVYINKKDHSLIAFTGSSYQIFNLSAPYGLRGATPAGFSSLLMNEYAASYSQSTRYLTLENILSGEKINCTITNEKVIDTLKDNFDASHFSVSPKGDKVVLSKGDNTFFWKDISAEWPSSASSDCLNSAREVELSGIMSIPRLGKWYADSNYLASADRIGDAFMYNFDAQRQVITMAWDGPTGTTSVGYNNNDGYHDTASLNYGGYEVQTARTDDEVRVYIVDPKGKKHLVNSYDNAGGSYYHYTPYPPNWVVIQQDPENSSHFHFFVLDGYNFRQVLDVSIKK